MVQEMGSRPGNLLAGIGPSLGPCCAEFVNFRREFPQEYWSYGDDQARFDLWALAHDHLTGEGLEEGNIKTVGICSRCRGEECFSHRGQGPLTGRMGAVLGFLD